MENLNELQKFLPPFVSSIEWTLGGIRLNLDSKEKLQKAINLFSNSKVIVHITQKELGYILFTHSSPKIRITICARWDIILPFSVIVYDYTAMFGSKIIFTNIEICGIFSYRNYPEMLYTVLQHFLETDSPCRNGRIEEESSHEKNLVLMLNFMRLLTVGLVEQGPWNHFLTAGLYDPRVLILIHSFYFTI